MKQWPSRPRWKNGPQTPRLHGPRRKRRKNADDPLRCRAVDHHPGRSTPKGPNGRRSMLLTSPSMEDDDTASRSILANYRRIPYGAARNFRLASRVGTTFCASAREGPGFPPGPSISNRRTNLQGSRLALHAAASNAPCKLAHLRDQIARNRSNFSCCCGSWARGRREPSQREDPRPRTQGGFPPGAPPFRRLQTVASPRIHSCPVCEGAGS